MRTYVKVKKEWEEDRLEAIECDWCRKVFHDKKHESALGRFNHVSDISNYIDTFTLEWLSGLPDPDGHESVKKANIELCYSCREKIKQHLKELGIRINESTE